MARHPQLPTVSFQPQTTRPLPEMQRQPDHYHALSPRPDSAQGHPRHPKQQLTMSPSTKAEHESGSSTGTRKYTRGNTHG
jgi:hypothetical protein